MISLRAAIASCLALSLFFVPSTADAAKGKKKKKDGAIAAVVESFEKSKDETKKDDGVLKVKTVAKKKGAPAQAGAEKTFAINKDTKVEKLVGKKKDKKLEAASIDDVKAGAKVTIVPGKDGAAEKIVIAGKKGKKKKANA